MNLVIFIINILNSFLVCIRKLDLGEVGQLILNNPHTSSTKKGREAIQDPVPVVLVFVGEW